MSEEIRDGILFVTGPLSDPYKGIEGNRKVADDAFWEAKITGADLTEDQRQAVREKTKQFRGAVAWFKESSVWIPPGVVVGFIQEARGLLEHLGYDVDLDPGPMPS